MIRKTVLRLMPALVLMLVVTTGCDRKCPPAPTEAAVTPRPDISAVEEGGKTENIKLEKSSSGGVLILDEGKTAPRPPAGDDDGLSPRQRPPADYPPFQDQHVKLYTDDISATLPEAVRMATAAGAQVIDYPIKGFENMGPNEKTLVFDYRMFLPYLDKISTLGRVEHPKIARSDFVTVRLTVLTDESGD